LKQGLNTFVVAMKQCHLEKENKRALDTMIECSIIVFWLRLW
jgi:hypothetical protein